MKMKIIRFYRDENDLKWYADIPEYINMGGNKSDLEMVAGADVWLDIISNYKDSIRLSITDDRNEANKTYSTLSRKEYKDYGAVYVSDSLHELWLCEVTSFVFGSFPNKIYYKQVK